MMKQMNYIEGQKFIENLHDNNVSGKLKVYQDLEKREIFINTPGFKGYGDYRLEVTLNGYNKTPTHSDICRELYNSIINKHHTYEELLIVLEQTY